MTKENPILDATSFDKRIIIIPSKIADRGTNFLRHRLDKLWPDPKKVVLMPVSLGGDDLGERLSKPNHNVNAIQMSHTGPNATFLPDAICVKEPDYEQILLPNNRVKPVVVIDAVIEGQGTGKGVISVVNNKILSINAERGTAYPFPEFFFLALILKISETESIDLPNVTGAFWVWKDIWVSGRGPDLDGLGRNENDVKGILSPRHTTTPVQPYYKQLF